MGVKILTKYNLPPSFLQLGTTVAPNYSLYKQFCLILLLVSLHSTSTTHPILFWRFNSFTTNKHACWEIHLKPFVRLTKAKVP